jgi:hypothetical protein
MASKFVERLMDWNPAGEPPIQDLIRMDDIRSMIKMIPFGYFTRNDIKQRFNMDAETGAEYDAISDSITQTDPSKRARLMDNLFDLIVIAKMDPRPAGFDTPAALRAKISEVITAYNAM